MFEYRKSPMTEAELKTQSHPSWLKNRLFQDCYNFVQSDSLELPTIPDCSAENPPLPSNEPNASSNKIAKIVQIRPQYYRTLDQNCQYTSLSRPPQN